MYAVRESKQPLVDQPKVEQTDMDERLLEDLEDLIRFRKSQVAEKGCHQSFKEELSYFEQELDKLCLDVTSVEAEPVDAE